MMPPTTESPIPMPSAETLDRITIDPQKMNGQPCLRNKRLTVARVLEALAIYPDRAEFQQQYPGVDDEDIRQALLYASRKLQPDD